MATYYVRKSGDDGNAGTSAGAAWATIDKAANEVAAGDTVYIGAGRYTESVTMDTPGSSGNPIRFIGDVAGIETGDAGLIVIDPHPFGTSGYGTTPNVTWDLNSQTFVELHDLWIMGGDFRALFSSGSSNFEGVVLRGCVFTQSGSDNVDFHVLAFDYGSNDVSPSGDGLNIDSCFIYGGIEFLVEGVETDSYDWKLRIANSILWADQEPAIYVDRESTGTFYPSGGIVQDSFLMSGATSAGAVDLDVIGSTGGDPFLIRRCYVTGYYVVSSSFSAATDIEDSISWTRFSPQLGSGSETNHADGTRQLFHLGMMANWILQRKLGFSPYHAWELIEALPDGSPLSEAVDWAGTGPSEDAMGNPRPAGRGRYTIGPIESPAYPQRETTTTPDGEDDALRFEGAGHFDSFHEVDGTAITVTVQARRDANYGGAGPIIEVYDTDGTLLGSDTLAVLADTWEELSVADTPAAAGVIRVRRRSRDTSANGECYFGEVAIS